MKTPWQMRLFQGRKDERKPLLDDAESAAAVTARLPSSPSDHEITEYAPDEHVTPLQDDAVVQKHHVELHSYGLFDRRRLFSRQSWIVFGLSVILLTGNILFAASEEWEGRLYYGIANGMPAVQHLHKEPRVLVELHLDLPLNDVGDELDVEVVVEQELDGEWMPITEIWTAAVEHGKRIRYTFDLEKKNMMEPDTDLRVRFTTEQNELSPLSAYVVQMGEAGRYQVLFAFMVLALFFVLIAGQVVHLAIASLLCSSVALGVMGVLRHRPPLETIVTWMELESIMLLFGMMLLVGIFSITGFFEWCAVQAYKVSGGKLWWIYLSFGVVTGVASAFLDNVTTILLMGPVTVRLCKVMDHPPSPLLITQVLFSNIGGAATIVGDIPNVIIGSALSDKIGFMDFVYNLFPPVFLCFLLCVVMVRFMFRSFFVRSQRPHFPEYEVEIEVWRKTLHSLLRRGIMTTEERKVVHQLRKKIAEIEAKRDALMATQGDAPSTGGVDIAELEALYPIKDPGLFVQSAVVMTVVVVLFCIHGVTHFEIEWAAALGAITLLLLFNPTDIEVVMEKVEWATLLFLGALFVLMECLSELGLVDSIGDAVKSMLLDVNKDNRLAAALLLIVWVSAFGAMLLSNIPFTTTMLPVILTLADDDELDLPIKPMAWALALGACLGGNGTLVGCAANVVAAGVVESSGGQITFFDFFKRGFPVTIATILVASVYLLVTYVALEL